MTSLFERVRDALSARYRLEAEVGSGGSATVFRAQDLRHPRKVAVKVLSPDRESGLQVDRFLREIRTISRLNHPHVLPLLDSGEADGLPYYVMPFMGGTSLRDLLRERGPLPFGEVLRITREMADAIDYAHGAGVVHRDIKPANVLLRDDHVALADFGIARAVDVAGGDTLTEPGSAIGTPHYMSPEQATGEEDVDERSDVYALACVTYEMLVGEPPFAGSSPRVLLARKLAGEFPSPRVTRQTLPDHVEPALRRGLHPEPAERFSTAMEFADALGPAREAAGDRSAPGRRRVGHLATLALALLTALAVFLVLRPPAQADPALVAVAPLSGEAVPEGLRDRAAQDLTRGLQATGVVQVVPFETVRATHDDAVGDPPPTDPVRRLADATRAGIVVTGSFVGPEGRVGLGVDAVDTRTGQILGSVEPIVGTDADAVVAEVRSRLMSLIALRRDPRVPPSIETTGRPPTWPAYRHFDDALALYSRADFQASVRPFEEAFAEDTTFHEALLYASVSLTNVGDFEGADSLLTVVATARDRLSDYDRAVLDYRRAFVDGRPVQALEAVRRAAEAAPGSKIVYNLAIAALETRRLEEAFTALRSLSPDEAPMQGFIPYWELLTTLHHLRGEHERELEAAREARRRYPGRLDVLSLETDALAALGRVEAAARLLRRAPGLATSADGGQAERELLEGAREIRAHGYPEGSEPLLGLALEQLGNRERLGGLSVADRLLRAEILYEAGRWAEADSAARTVAARWTDHAGVQALLARTAARMGDEDRARRIDERLAERPETTPPFGWIARERARIAVALGARDTALAHLADAFARGFPFGEWVHRDPDLAELREMEGYRSITEPIA